jgi:hypothetical protein
MAWRLSTQLIDGELDNTVPNRVTGWLRIAGLPSKVALDLAGNFHRDIRGAVIRLTGDVQANTDDAADLDGLALEQTGDVGDITAGRPPADYSNHPYIEWYSRQNGRVVIELEPEQVEVIGRPIPAIESDPISREQQEGHMRRFLGGLADGLNRSTDD